MNQALDSHEHARRMAVLEERMNPADAELEASLERFRKDMVRHHREYRRWSFGLTAAVVAVIIASIAGFNL